ncbi:hypothetical protein C6P46_001623 [Rhodotorula mucilaginosa]|uniref:Uncharacterized protein n=1 Tax=Rhodotorula mucilaginosa TaxID=5537 RepID=A0A9P6VSQ5_RHOMI|nr:hypothetical protein C6P46_001623 [Rhodotorula mucilaginosa]
MSADLSPFVDAEFRRKLSPTQLFASFRFSSYGRVVFLGFSSRYARALERERRAVTIGAASCMERETAFKKNAVPLLSAQPPSGNVSKGREEGLQAAH